MRCISLLRIDAIASDSAAEANGEATRGEATRGDALRTAGTPRSLTATAALAWPCGFLNIGGSLFFAFALAAGGSSSAAGSSTMIVLRLEALLSASRVAARTRSWTLWLSSRSATLSLPRMFARSLRGPFGFWAEVARA